MSFSSQTTSHCSNQTTSQRFQSILSTLPFLQSSVYPLSGIWANLVHRAHVGFMGTRLRTATSERSHGFHLVLLGLLPCETVVHAGDTGLDGPWAMALEPHLMVTAGM